MKRVTKKLLGCIRRADNDFGLIKDGDSIAVGVSGGKDSLVLLHCLSLYKQFTHKDFSITAITVGMGLEPFDVSGVTAFCAENSIPYHVIPTNIGQVIFESRKEKNPCALCANLRRGTLNNHAKALGCNKVALGHHRDDVIETFLMSLLYEGRLNTFTPLTHLSRVDLDVIRPLVYVEEGDIITLAGSLKLPVIASPCPACGHTARQKTKDLLKALSADYPDIHDKLINAISRTEQYHLWEKQKGL